MIDGVSLKLNASSAKVWKFIVEIESVCMKLAAARPMAPPSKPSSSASTRNATRIAPRENPTARRVPISLVREATLDDTNLNQADLDGVEAAGVHLGPGVQLNAARNVPAALRGGDQP